MEREGAQAEVATVRLGRLSGGVVARLVLGLVMAVAGLSAVGEPAQAAAPDPGLLAWYKLDESSGTVAADSSGNNRHGTVAGNTTWRPGGGFQFGGGAASSGNAIKLPDNLLQGLTDITVDFDVRVATDLSGLWSMFNLGNQQIGPTGNGYLFVTGADVNGKLRGALADSGSLSEQSASAAGPLASGVIKHVTYIVRGGTVAEPGFAGLYVDGQLVAQNNAITTTPEAIGEPDGASTYNWLGRSANAADNSFKGVLSDFRIYGRALSQAEVTDRMDAKARATVEAIELVDHEGVRGNMTLPITGADGAQFSWSSSNPDVVSPTGIVTRPAHGQPAATVELTVTGTVGSGRATRTIAVTVLPMPRELDYEAYTFAYFTGETTSEDEAIYFAASKGNDAMAWDLLNNGRPVLGSSMGTKGLRDPFLIRSHEGDKFWLLATDLRAYPAVDFGEAQESGSKHLMVWESTDLVHWSDQRMVKVSSDHAGNTWAPEAFYDEASGEYVVYWASNLYSSTDTTARDSRTSYNRMMYATTRDFRTFSEARPWVDVKRGEGRGMIDATVVRDDDTFYRFIKDEASFTVRQEKSTDLKAVVTGSLPTATSSPWSLVKEKVGVGQPNPWGGTFTEGEGPTVFRDNLVPGRWWMLIDQPSYHGGQGYVAFRTDDIASGNWTSVPVAQLPTRPRHGSVIPITQEELDRLRGALQKNLLATEVDPVTVTTSEGVAPKLPESLPVTYADGSTRSTSVSWESVSPAQYAEWGSFQVTGDLPDGQSLSATATVEVRDALAPEVRLDIAPDAPDGLRGWFRTAPSVTAAATDDESGVARVELSTDNGRTWSTATGSTIVRSLVDGRHQVGARAVDASGNTSASADRQINVDTTPAVSRATWDAASRTVAIAAADNTSGVDRIEYRLSADTAWRVYTVPIAFGNVNDTVSYRAVDLAGNTESTNTVAVSRSSLDGSRTSATLSRSTVKLSGSVTASVTVTGAALTPTGSVRIIAGGDVEVGRAVLSDGRATVPIDTGRLGVGTWDLTVQYLGDSDHSGSSTTVILKVTKG